MKYVEAAVSILKKLNENNYQAYFVGGYVRDKILGLELNDIDIATNALPKNLKEIFSSCKETGLKYNSVCVLVDNYEFEITTFRKDIQYFDNRHPIVDNVNSIEEDLRRRDFTINALAMDINGNVIDIFNGLEDLKNKTIKAIGIPQNRFEEDALRMLRAFYLVSKLDFQIEKGTLDAIREKKELVANLSNFRIMQELGKIIRHNKNNECFKLMISIEFQNVLKGLERGIKYIVENDIITSNVLEFYTICFYLNGEILKDWPFTKKDKEKMEKYIFLMDKDISALNMFLYGVEQIKYINNLNRLIKRNYLTDDEINNIEEELVIHSFKDVDISVNEIKEHISRLDGSWIGDLQEKIIIEIINGNLLNQKEEIIKYIEEEGKYGKHRNDDNICKS